MAWTVPSDFVPALLLDLFPAQVDIEFGDGRPPVHLEKVRVSSTHAESTDPSARVFIFQDSPSGPEAHTIAIPTNIYGEPTSGYTIELGAPFPAGTNLTVRPMSGCGCGSKLRSFRPFSTMKYTA